MRVVAAPAAVREPVRDDAVTAANIAAATFPDGEELTMIALDKNDVGTTSQTLTMDWWRCYQLR